MIATKRIATADTDVLQDALHELHWTIHTPEGIHGFSESRRALVETGMKCIQVALELKRRGMIPTPCPFCLPDTHYLLHR